MNSPNLRFVSWMEIPPYLLLYHALTTLTLNLSLSHLQKTMGIETKTQELPIIFLLLLCVT